jgi:hypothetical protein
MGSRGGKTGREKYSLGMIRKNKRHRGTESNEPQKAGDEK